MDVSIKNWDIIWEKVLKHLEETNVILSEEALWYDAEKFLASAIKKVPEIKVIIYLRRQDVAMESYWNQLVKGVRSCSKTFQNYLESDGKTEIEEGLHYLKKLDKISEIIGKENLIVRVYEKQQLKGTYGIVSDFLTVLGIKPRWDEWKQYPSLNSRLYGNYTEIKRVFNSIRTVGCPDIIQFVHFFEKLSNEFGKKENGYFERKDRERFYAQFKSENEQIARKYLGRDNGILFYDEKMDYPTFDMGKCSSFEEDLIRTFSAMLYEQSEKIKYLQKQNNSLAWRVMLRNQKSRKLLFFGAGQKCKELLDNDNIQGVLIVDNDKTKESKNGYKGIEIIHAERINEWFEYFVVITCVHTDEIEEQLQEIGLRKEEDYVLAKEFF